ncbi:hypothetical protein NL108_006138 [Boleophthalmus pectinirostris]|nr:hypothetical protein NL108_006138 [Boleophthalmus pectinirostris]
MNIIGLIRRRFGQKGVKALRHLERLEKARARYNNHLRFNLRCRDENITPASINIKTPIPTHNAKQIVNKAKKALLNERIRTTINKQKNIERELMDESEKYGRLFPMEEEAQRQVSKHLENTYELEFKTTKERHVRKLKLLIEKKHSKIETSLTKNKDKWVCNLTQRKITETETNVLTRGLNFATTPYKIPIEEYILATELACQKIPNQGQKADLRNTVTGILKTAKLPKSNITKKERKAINHMKKDNTIIILPADKGRTTVILDKKTYEHKMEALLADTDTYEIIKKNPTEEKKRTLKTLLKPLLEQKKITREAYNDLIPTASITPRIYGTPKIHKTDTPLRPIVDSIGSVTYNLSKALVEIIKPLIGQTKFNCKNAKQLAQELKNITIAPDEILISHDVISLFTKTPVDVTLRIVQEKLKKDRTLKKRTNLTVDDITQLLRFVAKSTYFQYNNIIYRQKEGFAMGDPLSAIMSSFFMEDLEQKAFNTHTTTMPFNLLETLRR